MRLRTCWVCEDYRGGEGEEGEWREGSEGRRWRRWREVEGMENGMEDAGSGVGRGEGLVMGFFYIRYWCF